jgi:Predicted signal transduction protein
MITLTTDQQKKKEKTEMVLNNIYNLPLIPKIIVEVTKILSTESVKNPELVKVISKDQGLVTKILSIANSPLYGIPRKVTTIDFAILILGVNEIRNIVSALSIIESFKNKTDKYLDQKEFWLHSFVVGSAAKRLTEDFGDKNSGEAFIAGLLHDVGISVIHRYFHSNFVSILELVKSHGKSYFEAEIEVLGLTHEQIGFMLLEKWNFPISLCDAVLHHREPAQSKFETNMVYVVHLADYMTQKLGVGSFEWDRGMVIDNAMLDALGFKDENGLNEFIGKYEDLFKQQEEYLRI